MLCVLRTPGRSVASAPSRCYDIRGAPPRRGLGQAVLDGSAKVRRSVQWIPALAGMTRRSAQALAMPVPSRSAGRDYSA